MERFLNIIQRHGAWIFVAAAVAFFLSLSFLDSVWGVVVLILGSVALLLDPAAHLIARQQGRLERIEQGLWVSWGLALASIGAFLLRNYLEAPVEKAADGDALISRIRLALLFVFLATFAASFAYRLMLGLAQSARAQASQTLYEQKRNYLKSAVYSVFAAVPVLILVNYGAAMRNASIDLSPGYYSYSEEARSIIRSVDRKVEVYAFLPELQYVERKNRQIRQPQLFQISEDVRVMLQQLPVLNSKIDVQFENADLADFETTEFGNVTNGTIIFRVLKSGAVSADDKPYVERRIYVNSERDLNRFEKETVRGLIFVASPQKKIYFTATNGERYNAVANDQSGAAVEGLKEQLRFFNATLVALDRNQGWPGPIPDDADAVFVLGPAVPFSDEAREGLLDFLRRGGKVFAAIDPEGDEDLSWLLGEFGGGIYTFEDAPLTNTSISGIVYTDGASDHPITEDLGVAGQKPRFLFPGAGYFEAGETASLSQNEKPDPAAGDGADSADAQDAAGADGAEGEAGDEVEATDEQPLDAVEQTPVESLRELRPQPVLYSTYDSYVDANRNGRRDDGEKTQRLPMGLAYEAAAVRGGPRLTVYSGVNWLTDGGLRFRVQHNNLSLATQSLFWMTEDPLVAQIAPEERDQRTVQVTDDVKFRLYLLGLVLFPALVTGGLATIIFVYRKKRRFIGQTD